MAYFRFFIPNLLPQSVKIALYLDVDMLCVADLRGLFTLNLQGSLAACVKDRISKHKPLHPKSPKMPRLAFSKPYYNSGFLLMNLQKWRKDGLKRDDFAFFSHYKLIFHDQDMLNLFAKNQILTLPFEYNLLANAYIKAICVDEKWRFRYLFDYTRKELNHALLRPVIVHFTWWHKAWSVPYEIYNTKGKALGTYWWDVALQTPFFSDELKAIFANIKQSYLAEKDFKNFVAFSVLKQSQSVLGYLKMPFFVHKIFKKYDKIDNEALKMSPNFSPAEQNLANEIFSVCKKASKSLGRLISLPWEIFRTKYQCEKYGLGWVLGE